MSDAPNEEGWIEWSGGQPPVDSETRVLVRLRGDWESKTPIPAKQWNWAHDPENHGGKFDIIAYQESQP